MRLELLVANLSKKTYPIIGILWWMQDAFVGQVKLSQVALFERVSDIGANN